MRRRTVAAWACPALLVIGCGMSSSESAGDAFAPSAGADASAGAAPPGEPAPEKEVESDYEAPVATGSFVWVANPKSGRVAYVDAKTLQVRTVEAGNGPTFVGAVPGQIDDTTLVLNVLSEDATLLRATPAGIASQSFKVAPQANSMAFSADGRFAIVWADARKVQNAPKTQGFQDLTVLDLTAGTSTILAVGYRPVFVGFAAGAARAHAVTQDGVAILDLSAAPVVTRNVAVSDTPNEDPGSRDVSVTPDGKIALIRRDGAAAITAVTLETGARVAVTLPGPVTDLDLNDAGDRAVAVVRSTSQVAILPVPGILQAPTVFTTVDVAGETIGSVALAPGGRKGLLYTNATDAERVTILDMALEPPPVRTVRLYAPVLAVFSSPDARHAVVLHDKTASVTDAGAASGAFSLLPIANALPAKIVATEARPSAVAVTDDRAVIAERDDAAKVFGVYLARMPQLMVERYPLASPPIAVGVVAGAKRAFIAQQHPEGRLTFIDLEAGVARTLTGFELSARVVDGSKP
ncbi:MAG: hypothetical protein KF819_01380 [Labilithrix sp.]|nr:hypothetical protein [Labilithrix sp.]